MSRLAIVTQQEVAELGAEPAAAAHIWLGELGAHSLQAERSPCGEHLISQQRLFGALWVGGAVVTEMPKEVTPLGSQFRQQISGMEQTPRPRRPARGAVAGLGVPVHGV